MKPPPVRPKADPTREARLAKALRDNLRRRKANPSADPALKADEASEIGPCAGEQSD